jgi:hypothetical protein
MAQACNPSYLGGENRELQGQFSQKVSEVPALYTNKPGIVVQAYDPSMWEA